MQQKEKSRRGFRRGYKRYTFFRVYYLYYSWIAGAQKAIKNAKSLFENAKNKQEELNDKMNKSNVELLTLEQAYKVLQTKKS